jgi:hypothetical protein
MSFSGPKRAKTSARSSSESLSRVSSSWLRTKRPSEAAGGNRRELAQRPLQRLGRPARQRQVHGLVADEVEHHVQLVAVLVAQKRAHVRRLQVDLAEQDRLAVAPVHERAQVAQDLVRVVERALDQERHGVDAEARKPLREPEGHHLRELVADGRVRQVEIRLVRIELVQVVPLGLAVVRPVGVLPVGEDDVAGLLLGLLLAPDVEVAVRRIGARTSGLKPGVLVGRVVHDEVHDHADAAVVAGADQLREVAERPE